MSTITTTQHGFSHKVALAAAATVIIAGGATALGASVFQHDSTTPAPTQTVNHMCTDNRCLPGWGWEHNATPRDAFPPPVRGGRVMLGQP